MCLKCPRTHGWSARPCFFNFYARVTYLDPPEFFLEDHVEEARVEFPDSGGCGGDVHRILSTAQNHMFTNWGDGCRIYRTLRLVRLIIMMMMEEEEE